MSFGSITKSVSTDVDYYAILFRQQIENRGFITDDPDDVLFIPSTTGYAQTTTYTASGYSVGIPNVDLGHRNSVATNAKRPYGNWYQVTAFAVDIAGNKVQGTDPTQVKFLEIPIRPTDLDLQQNDDSGASNSDNITNIDDGWVISGQFGLTAGEQAANSDTTVSKIVLTVSHPESNGSVDIEIAKPAAGWELSLEVAIIEIMDFQVHLLLAPNLSLQLMAHTTLRRLHLTVEGSVGSPQSLW